jgi:hypothetical protein
MIIKTMILFRIQNFKHCRRRISPEIHTHFINFIKKHNRIYTACFFHRLNNFTWHRTNICSAVTSYLGFIPDTSKTNTYKISVYCTGYRFTERSFSNPGRSYKTEYLSSHVFYKIKTAICSRILSLGLSSPKWSSSRIFLT